MIFHEDRLLADNSHKIACIIFFQKLGKMSQNLSSAAVVVGALRVNLRRLLIYAFLICVCSFCSYTVTIKCIMHNKAITLFISLLLQTPVQGLSFS